MEYTPYICHSFVAYITCTYHILYDCVHHTITLHLLHYVVDIEPVYNICSSIYSIFMYDVHEYNAL